MSQSLMGNDKSPGLDGIPIEFYKTFWNEIGHLLIKSFNESYDNTELSESQKCAILSLIFKKGDNTLLKNYRPISLTNTDYRLLTFTLSLRLQKVIGSIVGPDQSAYIRSRFIGTNARLINDVIEYCNRFNKTGLILFLDFEKAFDTVEWPFIFETLKSFKFGKSIINWIKTLYYKPTCVVKNNGYFSDIINLKRGIRQGCAISAIIFILVIEILSTRLKNNKSITGISLNKYNGDSHEQLLSQYADDMSLFLENDKSILPAFATINEFSAVAGPKLNLDKTEGLWLGLDKPRQKDCNLLNIKWPNTPIRALGLYVGHNETDCYKLNWETKLNQIQQLANSWSARKITLRGKIYVIKSELISKIIYCATVLPIPDGFVAKLNKILYNFLWKTTEKVKRSVMTNDYEHGGLKMIDIESQFQALKAAWVPRFISSETDSSWTIFPALYFNYFGPNEAILKMNCFNPKHFPQLNIIPKFYQEVIIGFNRAKNEIKPINSIELLDSIIWGNRHFTYTQGAYKEFVLFNKNWCNSGFICIKDFRIKNHKIDQNYIRQKLINKYNLLSEINMLITAIKPYLPLVKNNNPQVIQCWRSLPISISNIESHSQIAVKKSKFFYNLIQNQNIGTPIAESKWMELYPNFEINFSQCYNSRIHYIKDYKLSEFNFKFYHNILPSDKNLYRWKLQDTEKCNHCNMINEQTHFLFNCPKIYALWALIVRSRFFTVEFRNANAAHLVYFNHTINSSQITALTALCYAIYTEYLYVKNTNKIQSQYETYAFIKNKLIKRQLIYKQIGWHNVVDNIELLLDISHLNVY